MAERKFYQPSFADWPAKRESIDDLVAEIDRYIPKLISDDRGLLIRGACLARAKRLLSAMLVLHDAGLVDVVTIPLRPILEQWLVSLWVQFRPATAVPLLNGEYEKSIEKINRLADLGFDPALYGPGSDLPSWETLSQWVGDDLEVQGQEDARKQVDFTYNLVYRGESLRSVHAGLGTVVDHLRDLPDDQMGLRAVRRESSDGRGEILWGATLVAMMAVRAISDFGLSTAPLDAIAVQLPPAPADSTGEQPA